MDNKKTMRNLILGLALPILLCVLLFTLLPKPEDKTPRYSEILSYMEPGKEGFDDGGLYERN